jgi:hypothetical protein
MVVYRAGSGQDGPNGVGGLVNNATYFVIRVDNTHIKLAASFEDAVAGTVIVLAPPTTAVSWHSLTPVHGYSQVATLNGGAEYDTFSVQPGNDPRGPLANAAALQYNTTFTDVSPVRTDLPAKTELRGVGGRINHVAGVPGNNTTFYAASEYGGLWKTLDAGDNWDPVTTDLPQVTWDVAVAPPADLRDLLVRWPRGQPGRHPGQL